MKHIGNNVATLAYGVKVEPDVASAIRDGEQSALNELVEMQGPVELLYKAKARVLAMLHLCESPIERVALAAMGFMVIPGTDCFPPALHDVMSGDEWPRSPVVIAPQFVIGRYRLDFLVQVTDSKGGKHSFALECDGADFHSNSEAREKDAKRDDYLRALGVKTLRYSGRTINRLSYKLAHEIAAIVNDYRRAA